MTPNIFVSSDHHFAHANFLTFKDEKGDFIRKFKDVDEMNETMIERHNAKVKDNDVVYFLGDFTFGKGSNVEKFATRLNGRKRLILGNHDCEHGREIKHYVPFFDKIMSYRQFGTDMFKIPVVLCHFPLHLSAFENRTDGKGLNIHGHLHQRLTGLHYHFNVCVENINYTPVTIEEVVDYWIKTYEEV